MKEEMDAKELNALISLLDDPDESVYDLVRTRLVSLGPEVIPNLENVWELQSFGLDHRNRIEDLIHMIQFDAVRDALEKWVRDGAEDLFEGALLIAKYQYPDLDKDESHRLLNKLHQDIWLELNDELTAFEKVKVFNHILFHEYGYRGNRKNYQAAQNSYINRVLESKKGNDLSLGIIYIVLAQRLNVPIYGVDLPHHFILVYLDEKDTARYLEPSGAPTEEMRSLFFLNPFNRGSLMNAEEISSFLNQLAIEPESKHFEPCDHLTIVLRLLDNLMNAYERLGYPEKSRELNVLKSAVRKGGASTAEDA